MKYIKSIALKALHLTNGKLYRTPLSGQGTIFCLHHVLPAVDIKDHPFNYILDMSVEKLEEFITYLIKKKYRFISLDELAKYDLGLKQKPFIIFTLDDGFLDNYTFAYPLFKKYNIPFTIYVTTGFIEQKITSWWDQLESKIQRSEIIQFEYKGESFTFDCEQFSKKLKTFNFLRNFILNSSLEELKEKLSSLSLLQENNHNEEFMTPQLVEKLSRDPLVTIGAHSIHHLNQAYLPLSEALFEIKESIRVLEGITSRKINHFAFPFGSTNEFTNELIQALKQTETKTSVTTISGNVQSDTDLHCLPRILLCNQFTQFSMNIRLNGLYYYLKN